MQNHDEAGDRAFRIDRLRLFELVVPALAHEISNYNQTILLSTQVLLEILIGLKRITDRYYEEHGDFVVGGMQYSTVKEELQSYFTDVLHGAECIENSVSELRTFARPTVLKSQSVSLNKVIGSASTLLANLIRKSTDLFTLELPPGLPEIEGNSQLLLQAVLYLILNACQSLTNRNQPLHISTRYAEEEHVVVCGATYGSGETAAGRSAEAGSEWLGVRQIMKRLGGGFGLESQPGKPTHVVLRLPAPARIG